MTYQRGKLIEAGLGSSTEENEFNIDNTVEPDARQHESLRYVYHSAKFSDHACWRLIHICHHHQQEIAFVKTTLKFPTCCITS